jgi:phage head maturation protease
MIELAPQLFNNIRKIRNIDESVVKMLFSHDNVAKLGIRVTSDNGGTFLIKP